MAKRHIDKAKRERRGEVEQAGVFALKGMKDVGTFGEFCRELEHHAREGAEFARVISNRTTHTDLLQQSYTALADKASTLQRVQPDPETAHYLRSMLVRDLLVTQDMEKHVHTDAMPADFGKRVLKTAAFTGLVAATGAGIALAGDVLGSLATYATAGNNDLVFTGLVRALENLSLSDDYVIGNAAGYAGVTGVLSANGLPLDTAATITDGIKVLMDARILDVSGSGLLPGLGFNEQSFALAGAGLGAVTSVPGMIGNTVKDINFALAYTKGDGAAVNADQELAGKAASEKFQLAAKLYNGDLTALTKQESAQAVTSPSLKQ